jgi:hypothetical protein
MFFGKLSIEHHLGLLVFGWVFFFLKIWTSKVTLSERFVNSLTQHFNWLNIMEFFQIEYFSLIFFGILLAIATFFPFLFEFGTVLQVHRHLIRALMMTCFILYCHYSPEAYVTKFLSSSMWMPFEKIGYSFYLMHMAPIASSIISKRSPIFLDLSHLVRKKQFL